jgi:uncharacterized caspase-like protein
MADEGLRRLFRKTCHCSRCRADAPGAGEAIASASGHGCEQNVMREAMERPLSPLKSTMARGQKKTAQEAKACWAVS